MNSAVYTLNPLAGVLSCPAPTATVQDIEDDLGQLELASQVRSGDYFALLATRLDHLSHSLEPNDPTAFAILQKIVTDLLFLQDNYEIHSKSDHQSR